MTGPEATRAEREERLGEIISDWLESREAGQVPDQQEWLARHPEFAAELREFFDGESELRVLAAPLHQAAQEARVDTPLPWNDLFTAPTLDPTGEQVPTSLGEYELLEEIGRGGMAVVYRARQKGLGRFVALKLFRADCLGRADELQRFRHEAEIIAHLDHPQIVSIYDFGESGGRGFFTMKLMDGGGLDTQLSRFAADPSAAARLVASVARAVHHAHQRGILHRDLKPSNILLTGGAPPAEYSPHVSDFGLAKRVGTDPGLTHSGAVLGTPAYMAPEQAAGAKNAITVATDVYGLGAVLDALLTGRAPFGGSSVLDVLAQVKETEPEPPRRTNARVPRDLETICLKCLHKEPHRRYESASAVADDLERWLRGEPIAARPVGPVERLWRWSRRQPVQASLAVALLLTLLTGFGLVFWQWRRAEANLATTTALRQEAETNLATMTGLRQNAEVLRQETLDSKNEVTANFHLAHEAVREIIALLEEGGALESRGLDPLHREVLLRAQSYFKRFLEHRSQDPTLRLALAQSSATLADIIRQTGTSREALDAYRTAIGQVEALQRDDPDSVTVNQGLALLYNQIASVHDALGRRDEALAALKRADAILEKALARHPADRTLQFVLASTYHNLGVNYAAMNRTDEALASYTESRKIYENLRRLQPDHVDTQSLLANTFNSIGMIRAKTGQMDEALRAMRKAIELSEPLAKRYPEKRLLKHALARQLSNLGEVLSQSGEPKKALKPLEQARGMLEELVRTSPSVTDFHSVLGQCHVILARTHLDLGELTRACESFESARAIFRRLAAAHPQVVEYRRRLGPVLMDLAETRARLQQDEAFEIFREARSVVLQLTQEYPNEPEYFSLLGLIQYDRAVAEHQTSELTVARSAVLEAIRYQQRAIELRGTEAVYRDRLRIHYIVLNVIERELGHIDEAVGANKNRRDLCTNNADELYATASDFVLIGNAVKSDAPKQQRCYDLAIETIRLAVKAGFGNAEQVAKDPNLTPLRARGDFQKLLGEMKNAKAPAPHPGGGKP